MRRSVWVTLVVALMLVPFAALATDAPTFASERSVARVGEAIVVEARGPPGAPIQLDGATQLANERGLALFALTRDAPGEYAIAGSTLKLTWIAPRLALDAPSVGFLGVSTLLRATLVWGANLTPVAGAELSVVQGDHIVATADTNLMGLATFDIDGVDAGAVSYSIVPDDPLLRDAESSTSIVWSGGAVPIVPPAPPEPPALPLPGALNAPPTILSAEIRIAGTRAYALVDVVDPDGDPVFVGNSWRLDGVAVPEAPSVAAGSRVQLTVLAVDGRGGSASRTVALVVPANLPPVATATAQGARIVNATIVFDAAGSSDPEGAALSYAWVFSDGASLTGPRVEHAFASAGPARATLTVRDPLGATSTLALDLAIQQGSSGQTLPGYRAPDGSSFELPLATSLERVLSTDPAPRLLLATEAGLQVWAPASDSFERVTERTGQWANASYQPHVVLTRIEVPAVAEGWTLARVRDPQPGLPVLGAFDITGAALSWWKEGEQIAVLVRSSEFVLDHSLPQLALTASIEALPDAYRIVAQAAGGAPIRSFRVEGPDGIVVDVTERTIDARVAPSTEERTFLVIVETLAGERAERSFTLAAQDAIVPLGSQTGGDPGLGAAEVATPGPHASTVILGLLAVALILSRRRS